MCNLRPQVGKHIDFRGVRFVIVSCSTRLSLDLATIMYVFIRHEPINVESSHKTRLVRLGRVPLSQDRNSLGHRNGVYCQ